MAIIRQQKSARTRTTPDTVAPISAVELSEAIGVDATRAGHLIAAVGELVERYAPGAPDAIKREAFIRAAGGGCMKRRRPDRKAKPLAISAQVFPWPCPPARCGRAAPWRS